MRASSRFGLALKLRRQDRRIEALRVARESLSSLRARHVVRENPAEAALLVNLTVMVEQLAVELQQPGAEEGDMRDALRILETFREAKDSVVRQMATDWSPYLQERLQGRQ